MKKLPPKLNSHSSPVIFSGGLWEILLIWTMHALGTKNQPYPRQYCPVMHLVFAESSCFSPELLVFIIDTKSSWLKFIQYILSTLIYSVFVCSLLGLIVIVILLTDKNSSLSLQWLLPVPIERGKKPLLTNIICHLFVRIEMADILGESYSIELFSEASIMET